jgi:hypothetical protein
MGHEPFQLSMVKFTVVTGVKMLSRNGKPVRLAVG